MDLEARGRNGLVAYVIELTIEPSNRCQRMLTAGLFGDDETYTEHVF